MTRTGATGRRDHQKVTPLRQTMHAVEIAQRRAFAGFAVVITDFHIEPGATPRDLLADIAEPDYAEPLAGHVGVNRQRVAPVALAGGVIEWRHVAHHRKQQGERVIGRAVIVGARAVDEYD